MSTFPIGIWVSTLETLSWVFIFTMILSVIPISAFSAGTKLLFSAPLSA